MDTASTRGPWITAAATIIAALITVFGVRQRERNIADTRVERVEQVLESTKKDLRDARAELAAVRTDTATTAEPTPTEPMPTVYDGTPIATRNEQGFEIRLYACRRESGAVRCYFTFTNQRAERGLQIAGYPGDGRYSRAYDDQGTLHTAEIPEISGASGNEVTIPENVTLRAALTFKSVPGNVKEFSVLKFVFHYAYNTYSADFPGVGVG